MNKYSRTPGWKLVDMMNCAKQMAARKDVSEGARRQAAAIADAISEELTNRGL